MICKGHSKLSIVQQCVLLSLCRSGLYYKPKGETDLNLVLMRLMDEQYLRHPHLGAARMYTWLTKDKGFRINRKRVYRLYYKVMGLRSVLPGKHTSKRYPDHKIYPYLLRDLKIERANQVWAMDITYVPMQKGFMYLVAIIDLYSRYVVHWSVSNTMEAEWCKQALEDAMQMNGYPEIINTDQGGQFTSEVFTECVLGHGIKLSMDGKGRAIDNAFIERLWRSVKYEKIYLNPPTDGIHLYELLIEYFEYYNRERRHQGIDDRIPNEVYEKGITRAA
jgi:putative transposase